LRVLGVNATDGHAADHRPANHRLGDSRSSERPSGPEDACGRVAGGDLPRKNLGAWEGLGWLDLKIRENLGLVGLDLRIGRGEWLD
jgi:hypothetical protein